MLKQEDMTWHALGFAELGVLCGSQGQRVNGVNNQKATVYFPQSVFFCL